MHLPVTGDAQLPCRAVLLPDGHYVKTLVYSLIESTPDPNWLLWFPHNSLELTPWLCINALSLLPFVPGCLSAILSPKLYQFFAPLESWFSNELFLSPLSALKGFGS